MSAFKAGVLGAVVVAGPTLYGMVQAGQLDPMQAVLRGGVVAIGVAIGASYVLRLVDTYHRQVEAAKRHEARVAAAAAEIDRTAAHQAAQQPARPPGEAPGAA